MSATATDASPQPLTPDKDIVITLKNVYKIYGEKASEVRALNGVNLEINRGEYCAIMGSSGSGKSTAMNIIGCLDRPTQGEYYLDGLAVSSLSSGDLATIRNRKLGFVFQQFHLLPQLTALDNVTLPMIYAGVDSKTRNLRGEEALAKVGLSDRLRNKPNQLSGGQQQRVAIARAIVNEPLILLADEPTGALDSQTTEEIMAIFEELHRGAITIIMVTHEHDVGARSDRIIHFKDGKVMAT